ncbi:tetratricopeptide repeat protein [Rickettsia peacockii]|nr:tetratricopeptide repeat protein [Rickettsia peacockii]
MLPDNPYIYCYQGYLLDEIGREDEALYSFDKALELGLVDATIYGLRGDLLFSLDRLEEALISYNAAISMDNNNDNYYARIASTHLMLGNVDQAITQLQRAIKLKPQEFLYKFILDLILEELRVSESLCKL